MKIILLGYMGSGKSSVGRCLSERLQYNFMDLDDEIVRAEKRSISVIFKKSGEIYFRKAESAALKAVVRSKEDFILALGGGTPCYSNNLDIMLEDPDVILIYLKTSLQELRERLWKERSSRPLISHLDSKEVLEDFIRKHLFERTYYYNQSKMIIDTDGKSVEEISSEIVSRLN